MDLWWQGIPGLSHVLAALVRALPCCLSIWNVSGENLSFFLAIEGLEAQLTMPYTLTVKLVMLKYVSLEHRDRKSVV